MSNDYRIIAFVWLKSQAGHRLICGHQRGVNAENALSQFLKRQDIAASQPAWHGVNRDDTTVWKVDLHRDWIEAHRENGTPINRGGPRPGSGRPPKFEHSTVLRVRVPTDVAQRIRAANALDQVAQATITLANSLALPLRPRKAPS